MANHNDPHNKKYMFDLNNFDEDAEAKKRSKEPAAPTFSLDDMEEARKQSYEKGKVEGARIARDGIEQRTEILVQGIAANLTVLEHAEDLRKKTFNDDAVHMTYHALKAVFPGLLKDAAETEIKTILHHFMDQVSNKVAFTLYVHPDMEEAIARYAASLHGNLSRATDPALPVSGARIEWDKGAAEWAPDKIAQKILDLMHSRLPDSLKPSELLDAEAKKQHNKTEQSE